MKKIFLMMLILSYFSYGFPKVEKEVKGLPWWVKNPSPVNGINGGVGISSFKLYDYPDKQRKEAILYGKAEILSNKNSKISSEFNLVKTDKKTKLKMKIDEKSIGEINTIILDRWYSKKGDLYLWIIEKPKDQTLRELEKFVLVNNKKIRNDNLNLLKYQNSLVVKGKTPFKINLYGNNKAEIGDVYEIYRIESPIKSNYSEDIIDYKKRLIGNAEIIEKIEKQATAKVSAIDYFKIKKGDIAIETGENIIETLKYEKIKHEEKRKSLNFDDEYSFMVKDVDKGYALKNRHYILGYRSDFGHENKFYIKTGLFDFFEPSFIHDFDSGKTFIGMKFGLDLNFIGIGAKIERDMEKEVDYLTSIISIKSKNKAIELNMNYKNVLDKEHKYDERLGFALNFRLSKRAYFGGEYITLKDDLYDKDINIKLNLQLLQDFWLSGGITWEDDRRYYLMIETINIY